MKPYIKPIELADVPDAAALAVELLREEGWPETMATEPLILAEMWTAISSRLEWGFIAIDLPTGKAIGMIELRASGDPVVPAGVMVFRFFVTPAFRGLSVGRELLAAAAASLPDSDMPVYISTVGPLRKTWKRMGFETVSLVHQSSLGKVRAALGRK